MWPQFHNFLNKIFPGEIWPKIIFFPKRNISKEYYFKKTIHILAKFHKRCSLAGGNGPPLEQVLENPSPLEETTHYPN